jgi:hypothetical protein
MDCAVGGCRTRSRGDVDAGFESEVGWIGLIDDGGARDEG